MGVNLNAKTSYIKLALGIYLNYAILGMAAIIISQYSSQFQQIWHTNLKGISLVISLIGIGRLLVILFAGYLSDKLGRKNTMLIGMAAEIIFLIGLINSPNLIMACISALFMGVANSFGDTSSYPALADAFNERSASMNSLVKAAMSVAQFSLPFIVTAVPNVKLTIVTMITFVVIGMFIVKTSAFAPQEITRQVSQKPEKKQYNNYGPKMHIDGIMLISLGFTLSFTFYIFSQYAPIFGTTVLNLDQNIAKTLISWYALASLVSVFITSLLVTKVKSMYFIFIYTFMSVIALGIMLTVRTLLAAQISSLLIGFFAAGGIWQLGLSILTNYFPKEKGKVTGYYSFATSLTFFVGPFVSSFVINDTAQSIMKVFKMNAFVTLISVIIVLIVLVRNRHYKF